MSACPRCGWTHVAADVQPVRRFSPGVPAYRTADGKVHATRDDAQEWLCERRQEARR